MVSAPRHTSKGFTLIEIAVVVVVIAILATLAALGISRFQTESLDAQRSASATTISEALEKYYGRSGEYPSCSALTQPPSTVSASVLRGISVDALKTPRGEDNSIRCSDLVDPNGEDFFSYTCIDQSDSACGSYSLKYISEKDGDIKSINSRRDLSNIPSIPTEFTANAVSPTQIDVEWPPVASARAYELQRSTSPAFSSITSTNHSASSTSTSVPGLAVDTTYYFRLRAVTPIQDVWLDPTSATTSSVTPPTGTIAIAAAMSGANARGTSSGGTCSYGSIEYQIRHQVNGGSWSSWTTGTYRDIAATEGHSYNFQSRARCVAGGSGSSYLQSTSTANVVRPVSSPGTISIAAAMSGSNARGTASGGGCATGTTISRQIRYHSTNTTSAGSWSGWTTTATRDVAANQGYRYTFQQQARCVGLHASSSWVASGTANVIRPIAAPGVTQTTVSAANKRWTWSNPTCPTGTSAQHQYRFKNHTSNGGWTVTTATSATNSAANSQGMIYGLEKQSRCITAIATGAWSGLSANKTFTVPVVHVRLAGAGMKMESASSATVRLRSFINSGNPNGTCASGTVREGALQVSINDSAWTFKTSWAAVNVNTQLTATGLSIAVNGKLELSVSVRCRNTTTGYHLQSGGAQYLSGALDRGNIYRRDSNKYNIICPAHGTKWSWCAGGYGSGGVQNSTNSTLNSCTIKKNGISDSSTRYTARLNFGTNPPCWNATPTASDMTNSYLNSI